MSFYPAADASVAERVSGIAMPGVGTTTWHPSGPVAMASVFSPPCKTADQATEAHVAAGGAGEHTLRLESLHQFGQHLGAGDEVTQQGQPQIHHRRDHRFDRPLRQLGASPRSM